MRRRRLDWSVDDFDAMEIWCGRRWNSMGCRALSRTNQLRVCLGESRELLLWGKEWRPGRKHILVKFYMWKDLAGRSPFSQLYCTNDVLIYYEIHCKFLWTDEQQIPDITSRHLLLLLIFSPKATGVRKCLFKMPECFRGSKKNPQNIYNPNSVDFSCTSIAKCQTNMLDSDLHQ